MVAGRALTRSLRRRSGTDSSSIAAACAVSGLGAIGLDEYLADGNARRNCSHADRGTPAPAELGSAARREPRAAGSSAASYRCRTARPLAPGAPLELLLDELLEEPEAGGGASGSAAPAAEAVAWVAASTMSSSSDPAAAAAALRSLRCRPFRPRWRRCSLGAPRLPCAADEAAAAEAEAEDEANAEAEDEEDEEDEEEEDEDEGAWLARPAPAPAPAATRSG